MSEPAGKGPLRVAVLISGRGSNMEALIAACADPAFPAEIVTVVSNRPGAGGLEKAAAAGIPTTVINHKAYDGRPAFEAALDAHLRSVGTELICLAGFMRLLTGEFVTGWHNKMINIHPSLLPAFKGLDTHERVLEAGVRFHGCTVHFVRAEMDDGPIIIQACVPVLSNDTPDTLGGRVLTQEHRIYPAALRLVAEGRVQVRGVRTIVQAPEHADCLVNPPLS